MPASRSARKSPAQGRSRETVQALLIAAARVFVDRGWRGATTNHIAEVAGVSVGSLYQYFPGKLALLAALKAQFVAELLRRLEEALSRRGSLARTLRRAIRTTLAWHDENRALLMLFAEELPVRLATKGRDAPHLLILRQFFHRQRRALVRRDPALAALIVGEMVDAVTRSALQARPEDLRNGRLEAELTDACLLYLRGR